MLAEHVNFGDARYSVASMKGVAFWAKRWPQVYEADEDGEFQFDEKVSDTKGPVIMVMVGDRTDRTEHYIDPSELVRIGEDDYCHECGQIACGHG